MKRTPYQLDGAPKRPASTLKTRPKKVALVAKGASCQSFVHESLGVVGQKFPFDEVWTLNRGYKAFMHNKVFIMDDLRWLQVRDPIYANELKKHNRPIITSTVYPEWPTAVAFPYQDVLEKLSDDIFNVNTVSYMVAYAIYIGVEELSIYGADFWYPGSDMSERGGQAVAYMLGIAHGHGMHHRLPHTTSLLYSNSVQFNPDGTNRGRPPYGYHRTSDEEMANAANKSA